MARPWDLPSATMGVFTNCIRNADGTTTKLIFNFGSNAMALGINSVGDVVGTESGAAFIVPHGGSPQTLGIPTGATAAFGIIDNGNIVDQHASGGNVPGLFLANSAGSGPASIYAPFGAIVNVANIQGVNDNGLAVGFYVGTDDQDHGLTANLASKLNGVLTGTAVTDPRILNVAGEQGATFVFSQILGVNDQGIAVGYYGGSTTSQHGILYYTNTGAYTFLDDPSEQFLNGAEVAQITGIDDLDEITSFDSDSAGVFHGFVACPTNLTCDASLAVPEPSSFSLECLGLAVVGFTPSAADVGGLSSVPPNWPRKISRRNPSETRFSTTMFECSAPTSRWPRFRRRSCRSSGSALTNRGTVATPHRELPQIAVN